MVFTYRTFAFLILGLLPLALIFARAVQRGVQELTTLRFMSVLLTWIGYHLSAWLALYPGEQWKSFLLVERYIDEGLLFSTMAMLAQIIGYDSFRKHLPTTSATECNKDVIPKIGTHLLLLLTVASLLLFVLVVGGPSEAWESALPRGVGQIDDQSLAGKSRQAVAVISQAVFLSTGGIAAFYVARYIRSADRVLFGLGCIIIASFHYMWFFSRISGAFFAFLSIVVLRIHGRKKTVFAMVCALIAIYMCWVGYNRRGLTYPGLANYFAFLAPIDTQWEQKYKLSLSEVNFLDALAPWTRKAAQRESEASSFFENIANLIWNLQPLPSELVGVKPLGRSLAEVMGTVGSVGITTPALAEIYYVFGLWGAGLLVVWGRVLAWFDGQSVQRLPLVGTASTVLCAAGLVIGLHSSTRAMTRPFLYAFLLLLGSKMLTVPGTIRRGRRRPPSQAIFECDCAAKETPTTITH